MKRYIRLIEQEIAVTKAAIDRHKGIGVYQDNCRIWQHHLEAYERILLILTQARPSKGKQS